ncbi:hypothetical protein PQX77_016976 [Marasmius sp. AFHP31]|nr:hypothetical protein PQX77_016976 [Marasmius sp. AFHP31]
MPKEKALPFNEEQLHIFDSYNAPMETLLKQHNLLIGKAACGSADPATGKKWFDNTRLAILDHPEFKGKLDYTQRTATHWSETVKDHLKNTHYNKIVKRHSKAVLSHVVQNTKVLNPLSNATTLPLKVKNNLGIVCMFGQIRTVKPGKELLKEEMSDVIKILAKSKCLKDSTLNPSTAYQMALTELWRAANQDLFELRVVKEGAGDIFNINASSDPQSNAQFLQHNDKLKESVYDAWTQFVEGHLPVHAVEENATKTEEDKIPCNTAGIPVFPDVDENEISFSKFKDLYGRWLQSLWEYMWPKDKNMPAVPTADLLAYPHLFYNNEKYHFPVPLGSPDLLQQNTMFDFLVYLKCISNLETNDLFIFQSKEAVSLGLTATQACVEDKRHTGDKLAVKPSDDNRENTTTMDDSEASANADSNDPPEAIMEQHDPVDFIGETSKAVRPQGVGAVVVDDMTSQVLGLPHASSMHPRASNGSEERTMLSSRRPRTPKEAVDEAARNISPEPKKRKGKKKVVEEVVEEADRTVAAEPKKRRGKKKAVKSVVDEAADKASENVTAKRKKRKTNMHWDIRLAPAKGTLERSPENVQGRTRQQARKNAQV